LTLRDIRGAGLACDRPFFHLPLYLKGVTVLLKCANPLCSAQFRYLHEGRLFEVETQYYETLSDNGQRKLRNCKGHVELYWLCDQCAAHVALRFDQERCAVMLSLQGGSGNTMETAIPHPASKPATGIARVLIRPLDLGFGKNRQLIGQIRARRVLKIV